LLHQRSEEVYVNDVPTQIKVTETHHASDSVDMKATYCYVSLKDMLR